VIKIVSVTIESEYCKKKAIKILFLEELFWRILHVQSWHLQIIIIPSMMFFHMKL